MSAAPLPATCRACGRTHLKWIDVPQYGRKFVCNHCGEVLVKEPTREIQPLAQGPAQGRLP